MVSRSLRHIVPSSAVAPPTFTRDGQDLQIDSLEVLSSSNAFTQTSRSTTTSNRIDKELDTVCRYIDRLLERKTTEGDDVPPEFICPITQEVMRVPVVARDGVTYDEKAICKWLSSSDVSPVTRLLIGGFPLYKNLALQSMIIDWAKEHADKKLRAKLCEGAAGEMLTRV